MSTVHNVEQTLADTWHAAKRELDEAKARFDAISNALRMEGLKRMAQEARTGGKGSGCRVADIQIARRAVLRAGVTESVEGIGERIGLEAAEQLFEEAVKVKLHSAEKLLAMMRAFGINPARVCDVEETVKPIKGYWEKRSEKFFTDAQLQALEEFEAVAFTTAQVYKAKPKKGEGQ